MCGRSSLTKNEKELEKRFGSTFYSDGLVNYNPLPNYNVAPSHFHPVITSRDPDHFQFFKWGFIPHWAKEEKIGFKMINARIETVQEKPSYKNAVKTQRCLVPFDGFYEWKKVGNEKIPYRIQTTDIDTFSVAGLWSQWTSPVGTKINTFTLLTQTPNDLVAKIHNRMPAILLKEQEQLWLDESIPASELVQMIIPYPSDQMKAYTVSKRVNKVKENDADLLKEVKTEIIETKTLFD